MNKRLIDKILNEVSLDKRVNDGVFRIEENDHMDALREYLVNRGLDEESVRVFSNRVLEGKYPERQAYNAKGILVTFPTPEYKDEAIKRGTHFEKDPTKGQSNLFSDQPSKPDTTPPKDQEKKGTDSVEKPEKEQPKTNLPVSQASPPSSEDTPSQTVQAKTTAAPQQTPTTTPTGEEPELEEPTELPPTPAKSPEEKEADRNAIKVMLKGDDYMLNEMIDWFIYNAPEYLKEHIEDHKRKYER